MYDGQRLLLTKYYCIDFLLVHWPICLPLDNFTKLSLVNQTSEEKGLKNITGKKSLD